MNKRRFIKITNLRRKKVVKIMFLLLLIMGIGYSTFNSSLFMNAHVEVAKLKVNVPSGEYLEHGTKTGTDCPAGSFCPGSTFSYDDLNDQGITACAIGSYSATKSGICTPCQGKTTSDVGSTSCDTECSNKTGVDTWVNATWNNNNSMSNLCTINMCSAGYTKNDNSCVANNYTVTLDNNNATTPGSTSVIATFNADIPTITPPTKRGYNFRGYNYIIEHDDPEPDEEILYIKEDGTSNKKWDLIGDKTLVAKWEVITITCNGGEYLPHDSTSCSSCPEGYSCSGGDYQFNETTDQGHTICPSGTYSTGGATTCSTCNGGVTSNPGATSCSTTCPNSAHVDSWVSGCTISTCDTGYENVSNACTARQFNITLDNQNADTPGSTSVTVTYNSAIPSITVPTKNGYTFEGYYTEQNGGGTQYINFDGSSAKNWDKTNVNKLYAKWTVISRNCSAGQYLPRGTTTCASCPAGSFCIGGTYNYKANEDQGITACAVGSYSGASSSTCTACTGLTTSGTGQTSCNAECSNNSNASDWNPASWNNNSPTGLCSIKTCTVGYTLNNNACEANELDFSNQTVTSDYSEKAVEKNVTAPTTGTGTYTYTKKSGESDITVSSAGVITIPANKTAGDYTIVITATDSNSHVSKDATYTVRINKLNATLSCEDKTYDGTEQTACTCTGGNVGGDYKATNAGSYTASCTGDANHNNPSNQSWTMNKKEISEVTNLSISNVGVVSWTNSDGANSYQISIDNTNWTTVPTGTNTTSYNYLNSIVGGTGNRTVYVKAINTDTTNYTNSSSANISTTVYTISLAANNGNYGTVNPASINAITGETYTTSGNTLTLLDGRTVTATATSGTGYTSSFESWSSESGTISGNTTITANFTIEITSYNITYNSNSGTFSDSTTTNNVVYDVTTGPVTKYSHTQNVDDTGLKTTNYNNNWTNANITGTDRGDTSKAHVVTIPGSSSLTVELYYNGESTSYDWVSVWAGDYPNYTASSNYNSTGKVTTAMGAADNNNKFGGQQSGSYTVNGNSLTNMGHATLTIPGDTVTFGFKSDTSQWGQGYGYYAIITGISKILVPTSGTYKEPTKTNYTFLEWNTDPEGNGVSIKDESKLGLLTDATAILYAQWYKPEAVLTCSNKTYDTTEQTACTCDGGTVGGDYKATNAGNYTASCTPDISHSAPSDVTWTMNKKTVNQVTNLAISNLGVASWTNSSDATSYQVSMDNTNWTNVPAGTDTTNYNYFDSIITSTGSRTVYVKAMNSDTANYIDKVSNFSTTVYQLSAQSNNDNLGTVSPNSYNVITGETYTTSGNVFTLLDGRSFTATATSGTGYTSSFNHWSSDSGTISATSSIIANFKALVGVEFDANSGKFNNNATTNNVTYNVVPSEKKYSHTSNVDDTGLKKSNYGNSWSNSSIVGTDRGIYNKAHVVTISGESSLTVDLYYNGQDASYDWVSVWAGSYPNYTASSNYSSTGKVTTANGALDDNNKFGGVQSGSYMVNGNSLTDMGHVTLTIPGDTVTFGFKSNGSGYGQGYGYYAIVKGSPSITASSGTYEEPSKNGYEFISWNTKTDGSGTNILNESEIATLPDYNNLALYAQWEKPKATLTCSDKTYNGTEQIACSCSGGTVGGDYKATEPNTYTASCTPDENHSAPSNKTWTMNKILVSPVTNLNVSTSGVVSWTNSPNVDSYQISADNTNWTAVPAGTNTTSYNYLNSIVASTGERTVYVKAISSNTAHYADNVSTVSTTVYTLSTSSNNTDWGTVSPDSYNVISGVTYTTSGNTLTLSDGRQVIANPQDLSNTFDSWSSSSGTVNNATSVIANFKHSINVTYNSNGGTFSGNTTTNNVGYNVTTGEVTKYSHTSNVDDTGLKIDNYGDNWTNENIIGSKRGNTSKAHVVSIPTASNLIVDLYYNGEGTSYDWVSVWAGNYPNYTAYNNYNSTGKVTTAMGGLSTNKYGGSQSGSYTVNGNSLTNMGHVTLTIPGDTVTFGFKSDGRSCGDGYGYYAVIKGNGYNFTTISGSYIEPTKPKYTFDGWNTESNGLGISVSEENSILSENLYAQWTENPAKITCSNKTYDGTEQVACTCSGGTIGGDYKATNVGEYTASCAGDANHSDASNVTWNMSKKNVNSVTDIAISSTGEVSWTNSSDATSYQISIDNSNWTSVPSGVTTTSYNYFNTIIATTGSRRVYVRAINSDTANYNDSSVVNKSITVYTLTINSNNESYGTVSPSTLNILSGESFSTSSNILTLQDGRIITATPISNNIFNKWTRIIASSSYDMTSGTIIGSTTITANFRARVFSDDSWATIVSNVHNNTIPSYYTVGSTKEVDMGTLGTHTLRIANRSTPSSCSNSSFSKTACGFVLEFSDVVAHHTMNPRGDYNGVHYDHGWNVGGWPATSMRSYVSSTVYSAIPSTIRSYILNTTVVSSHGNKDSSNFTSTDKLYLLSTNEVGLSATYDSAKTQTRTLDYYSANNNDASRQKSYNGSSDSWWLRSASSDSANSFYDVSYSGYLMNAFAESGSNGGVSPAFRIG